MPGTTQPRLLSGRKERNEGENRPLLRVLSFRFAVVFVLLFILSLPFPHRYVPDTGELLSPFFESLVRWSGRTIFGMRSSFVDDLISDSTGLYIHAFNVLIISAIIAAAWSIRERNRRDYKDLSYWFVTLASYYLAFQLFEYGFNKVFKWQFYLPEPNTLFTRVGDTPRDLLYWSVMGTSRPYVIFSGLMEVIPAFLLLFRRTRTLGGVIAAGVLVNVTAINFSFDISVKIYSCFLLLLSLIVLAPQGRRMGEFFFGRDGRKELSPSPPAPVYSSRRSHSIYIGIKALVIWVLLFDVLTPYFTSGIFNDDTAPRPPLHGGYEVMQFVAHGDTVPSMNTIHDRWKRVFIHRRGYLIIQTMDERMRDYELRLDTGRREMLLTDPADGVRTRLTYGTAPGDTTLLRIEGVMHGDSLTVETRKIDLNRLRLLQNEFHWVMDAL